MKRHSQNTQLSFPKTGGWGGKRRGAGRKNLSGKVNHMRRPVISARCPCHITLRINKNILSLRRKSLLQAFAVGVREARRFGLKVNQFGVLGNHIHLIIESMGNDTLSRGMQSLTIRLAKRIKALGKELGRPIRGVVFAGRFHLHVLKTPMQVRNALLYVLFNEDKHAHRPSRFSLSVYSSAFKFGDLKNLGVRLSADKLRTFSDFWADLMPIEDVLSPPQSWLGKTGWQRARV